MREQGLILAALGLSAAAGLFTTVGSLLGLVFKNPNKYFMSATLGFSAGVMIFISFVSLMPRSVSAVGALAAYTAFFAGIIVMFIIDYFVPHDYPGQIDRKTKPHEGKLLRSGFFLALGIGVHNFPEGIVTFVGGLHNLQLGLVIAIAIAINNIPEGLAISVPIYAATRSRRKAFWWSFVSGLTEPLAAGISALFLFPFLTPTVLGVILAVVAGSMVYIAFDELVPLSHSFGAEHLPIVGLATGMLVMALSLWLLKLR